MRRKSRLVRLISMVLILALFSTQFAFALTQPDSTNEYKSGTFIYSLDDPVEDVYVYSDDWFDTPSTTELNKHLKTLSLIATMASGTVEDEINFLKGIGFENISTNKYFKEGIYEDFSMGCAVASKPLTSNGKNYTLIAIVPRSYNYKSEWVSNFTIGDTRTEVMHVGFKSARDEILRLVQKHAVDYNINGDIKVWVAGHSRGAAVSNLVAGFLVDYPKWIGTDVTLNPDDMYGFTFGTPKGARESIPSACVSVVATASDMKATPGGGTAVGYQGTIVPSDARFNCIRNFVDYTEPNTYIVPNFTRYGQELKIVEDAGACKELMEMYLASVYPYLRTSPFYGADPDEFIPAPGMFDNQTEFMTSRIKMMELAALGLENQSLTGKDKADAFGNYVDGKYQDVLTAAFSLIFSLPDREKAELDLEKVIEKLEKQTDDIVDDVIQTVLSIFTAYLFEKQAYYKEHYVGTPTDVEYAVSSLLNALNLINIQIDSSNQFNNRARIVSAIDDLLKNADLPIDLNGESLADSIFQFTNQFKSDKAEISQEEKATGKIDVIEHAEQIAIKNTKALLTVILKALDKDTNPKYACLTTTEAAKAVERLIGYTVLGNNVEEKTVSLLQFGETISFNAELPEIVTAKTFIQNFRSLGTAHVHCNMLSWMKADDSTYIYSDLAEGRYGKSQTVHLYSANNAKIYYTMDGTTPTTDSDIYDPNKGIALNSSYYEQDYTIKAISVLNGEISPIWTYKYKIGAKTSHINFDMSEYQSILAEAQRQQVIIEVRKLVETMVPVVRTENQARGIKVFIKDSEEIAEFKAKGFKVLYDFYRAESEAVPKASDYKITKVINKKEPWYLNTAAIVGRKYYYKAVAKVYDDSEELVAETELSQGRYGCRIRKR